MSKHKEKSEQKQIEISLDSNKNANRWKSYLVLIILTFVLYANTLKNEYALDDAIVLTQNEFVQKGIKGIPEIFKYDTFVGFWLKNSDGKTAEDIQEEKKLVAGGRYRPLSLLTFAVEIELFGKTMIDSKDRPYKGCPFVNHFVNIILYILVICLLFKILYRIFPPDKNKKWYFSLPFIVCLLFVAHPIHTEAVANIKGRDEIMTLLGSLAAMWFTIKFFDTNKVYNLVLSGLFLFLGLLSKENAITFLAIIPITIYYFIDKKSSKNILSTLLPLIIASGIFLIIRASILGFGVDQNEISPEIMNNPFLHATTSEKYATIFFTLWMYIKLLFFPHPLTYDYYPKQIPIMNWSDPEAFLPFIFYLAIGIYAVYGMLKKRDVVSYSIWFYLLPLSVVSNIFFPVGTFMNERFIFISSIGFCIFIGWIIYTYLPKLFKNVQASNYVIAFVMIVVLSLYSVKTISRNKAWKNDLTLFTTDVQVSENSAKSNCSAGGKLLEEAQKSENRENKVKHAELCEKSIKYLRKSVEIYPEYIDALNLLGNAYYEHNYQIAESLHCYYEVLKSNPQHPIVYNNCKIVANSAIAAINLGKVSTSPENLKEIIKSCDDILKINSQMGEIHYLKAVICGRYLNNLVESLSHFEKADSLNNFNKTADFYKDIGVAYGLSENYEKSLIYFLKAIELDPNDSQTYINAGVTYKNLGDSTNSELYISKGIEIQNKNK